MSIIFTYIAIGLILAVPALENDVVHKIDVDSESRLKIGGLFPIHQKRLSNDRCCGPILLDKGIQRLEAMLYALDEINKNTEEWKIELGAMILDTCSSDSYALEQSLQFLQSSCYSNVTDQKILGVVGASNSAVSVSVANIFRLFKIPQISYASTSEELDNMYKYRNFFRVVPSDRFQVQVMLDILGHFKWTYVSAIASEGDYGEQALKNLQELVTNNTSIEICFAETFILPMNATERDYDNAVQRLDQHKKARVVIVFLNQEKVRLLLSTVKKNAEIPIHRFVWIASDGWGTKIAPVKGNEEYAENAITILPKRYKVEGSFDDYFLSLRPENNTRNPWFREFWEEKFGCSLDDDFKKNSTLCTGEEDLKKDYEQEGLVPMVMDSVGIFASAIRDACAENAIFCSNKIHGPQTLDDLMSFRTLITNHISKTRFNSYQGHGVIVEFDSERNIPINYKIYQYRKNDEGKYGYQEIGEWSRRNKTRFRMEEEISWWGKELTPNSSCSTQCRAGEERIIKNPRKRCCWSCRLCHNDEYLPNTLEHCQHCPEGYVPNEDHTSCMELELNYIGRDLGSPWALVPFCFAIFGILSTLSVCTIFFLYRKTPLIMAAGRELCYVILVGVCLCYAFTFIAILQPTKFRCGILRTGMGLGLAVCYSAIFTKTNRISRIFNGSIRIHKRPSYISPESQLVICSSLILIEILVSTMWLIMTPPTVRQQILTDPPSYISMCGFDGTSVILALLYNMILIILCTYYAYKTRNIPENFNESKYISFTMYASCIVWLAFIPIYCSSNQDYRVQAVVLCMNISVSGSVTLACLFLPKLRIVLFHPEKNVRYPCCTPNSSTPTICVSPVRFIKPNQNSPTTKHHSPMGSQELTSINDTSSTDQSATALSLKA